MKITKSDSEYTLVLSEEEYRAVHAGLFASVDGEDGVFLSPEPQYKAEFEPYKKIVKTISWKMYQFLFKGTTALLPGLEA